MNYKAILSSLIISTCSVSAIADHRSDYRYNHSDAPSEQFYDYARVTSATPIYETIEHRVPRQCRHRNLRNDRQPSATPAILGAIIGAAIGNELGHNKSNKRVGAVAGGILGGSIGSDIGKRHKNHHCNQYDIEYEERVVGYDVDYRYRGNTYSMTTEEHPGKKIRLKLYFEPVASL